MLNRIIITLSLLLCYTPAFAIDESVKTTYIGETVYMVLYRNSTAGAFQVYDVVDAAWETYSGAAFANYDTAATELGSSGRYVATVPATLCEHGLSYLFEWRVQAGGTPAEGDVSVAEYNATFDDVSKTFLPTAMIAGQGVGLAANVQLAGGVPIPNPSALGARLSGITTFAPVVPTLVTAGAAGQYTFTASSTDDLLRDANNIDSTKNSSFCFTGSVMTGDVYVGLFESPADVNDVSASLIDPSETASSKDAMRSGIIFRSTGFAQAVTRIAGNYYATDLTSIAKPGGTYTFDYRPGVGMTVSDKTGRTIQTFSASQMAGVDSNCAWGVVANVSGNYILTGIDLSLTGSSYATNTIPTTTLINAAVEVGQAGVDAAAAAAFASGNTKQTGDGYGRLGAPVGASISADIAAVDTAVGTIEAAATVTADRVAKQATFYVGSEGNVSRNIVTLNAWSSGTRDLAFDLSELLNQADTTISSVTSVTVIQRDGSPTITTSALRKHQNGKVAIWTTAAISSANAGTYDVVLTIETVDSNTIVVEGVLEVE